MTETPLAVVTDYPGLVAAFRARAAERQIAVSGDANRIAGLPDSYLQKLLGPKPVRRLGIISLGPLLSVLGVKLALIEDPDAIARFGSRIAKRDEKLVRTAVFHVTQTRRFYQKIGKIGGRHRVDKLSHDEIVAAAKNAALARWRKTSPEQRSEHARKLVGFRWKKKERAKKQDRLAAANRGAAP